MEKSFKSKKFLYCLIAIAMVILFLAIYIGDKKVKEEAEITVTTTTNTNYEEIVSSFDITKMEKENQIRKKLDQDLEYKYFELYEEIAPNSDLLIIYLNNDEILTATGSYINETESYNFEYTPLITNEMLANIRANGGFEDYEMNYRFSSDFDFSKIFKFSDNVLKTVQRELESGSNKYWTEDNVGYVLSKEETEKWLDYYVQKVYEEEPNAYGVLDSPVYKSVKGYKIDIDNDGLEDILIKKQHINPNKYSLYTLINLDNNDYEISRIFNKQNTLGDIGFVELDGENYIIQKLDIIDNNKKNYIGSNLLHYHKVDGISIEDEIFFQKYKIGEITTNTWNEESYEDILNIINENVIITNSHSKKVLGSSEKEMGIVEELYSDIYYSTTDYNNDGIDDLIFRNILKEGKISNYISKINDEWRVGNFIEEGSKVADFVVDIDDVNVYMQKVRLDTPENYNYNAFIVDKSGSTLIGQIGTESKYLYKILQIYSEEYYDLLQELDYTNDEINTHRESIFSDLEGLSFVYASGVGAWGNYLEIDRYGNFTGTFHDSDAGSIYNGISQGSLAYCQYEGRFEVKERIDENTFILTLVDMEYYLPENSNFVSNTRMVNLSEPHGLGDSDEFILCTPGKKVSELSESVREYSRFNTEFTDSFILYGTEWAPFYSNHFED